MSSNYASARISHDKVFDSLSPINNKLSGSRVKPFLINSGLPVDVLGKIWELSDLDEDGQLSRTEFLIAMQLVSKAKEGVSIPDQLPLSLLPFKTHHLSQNAPYMHQQTNDNLNKGWVVSIEEKTKSDVVFASIDTDKDGYVTGGELKELFLNTGLAQKTLANIWNLCDINGLGKLNGEQFALAMYFINKKISTGLEPPSELTAEMIPPSLRPKQLAHEGSFVSKDLEELQTQVTGLQREKLYYEQRTTEDDIIIKQKRTELSNLELEMESLFKTLSEREIHRSMEQKKLNDYEDKLNKMEQQLVELKRKYETEKVDIENLKFQISNIESSALNKENDLSKIKIDAQLIRSEKSNLEMKLNNSKQNLNGLTQQFHVLETDSKKNNEKMQALKQIQTNLNNLVREYGNALVDSAKIPSNLDKIKRLEEEIAKLHDQVNNDNFAVKSSPISAIRKSTSTTVKQSFPISPAISSPPHSHANQFAAFGDTSGTGVFDDKISHSSLSTDNDPFNSYDPFKDNDPFSAFQYSNTTNAKPFDDPFSNSLDPFKSGSDPFEVAANASTSKRKPPPRPAPPRPQTPTLKPAKSAETSSARPQSSIDFMSKNKFDVFNNFDPFSPTPKNNNSNWAPFTVNNQQNANNFDPFA